MADLKVAIADDSRRLMREGVARVLGDAGFQVVAGAQQAIRHAAAVYWLPYVLLELPKSDLNFHFPVFCFCQTVRYLV